MITDRTLEAYELLSLLRERVSEGFSWDEQREIVELLVVEVTVTKVTTNDGEEPEVTVTYAFDGSAFNRTGRGSVLRPALSRLDMLEADDPAMETT